MGFAEECRRRPTQRARRVRGARPWSRMRTAREGWATSADLIRDFPRLDEHSMVVGRGNGVIAWIRNTLHGTRRLRRRCTRWLWAGCWYCGLVAWVAVRQPDDQKPAGDERSREQCIKGTHGHSVRGGRQCLPEYYWLNDCKGGPLAPRGRTRLKSFCPKQAKKYSRPRKTRAMSNPHSADSAREFPRKHSESPSIVFVTIGPAESPCEEEK